MRLDEAKVILEENGYELLEEGKLGRALGIGALALGSLVGNANAISDVDIDNYEKQIEHNYEQNDNFLPNEFIQNKSGDYVRKINAAKYTKFEIIYKNNTAKTITKYRNGKQIICYFENIFTSIKDKIKYNRTIIVPSKMVFINSNNKIDFILDEHYFYKNGIKEKFGSDLKFFGFDNNNYLTKKKDSDTWYLSSDICARNVIDISDYRINMDYSTYYITWVNK